MLRFIFCWVSLCLGFASAGIGAVLPDFSGEWRLRPDLSDFAKQAAPKFKVVEIDHRDPTLILRVTEEDSRGRVHGTMFHSTDNVERINDVLGNAMKAKTRWDGAVLEMTTTGKYGENEIKLVDRYEMSADGAKLTVKRHFEGSGPQGPFPAQDQVLVHEAAELKVGVARVEITPTKMLALYGYANRRCGPAAKGTHDALWAKVVVLESALERIAIVTADLGNLVSARIGKEAAANHGVKLTLLAASHSHSAPTLTGNEEYLAEIEGKILGAIGEAVKTLAPARLRIGKGSVGIGYNRLTLRENGRARALFDNLDRLPLGPTDEEFQLVEVTDAAGNARALLVHHAVHAVVLGPTNCEYSADYPGAMQTTVEKALPGVQVMFVQGGAGDVNPIFQGRSGDQQADFALVEKLGNVLASAVVKARSGMRRIEPASQAVSFTTETLRPADRWKKDGTTIEVGLATVRIGRDIAIAAMPGEPMHKLQKMWKSESGVASPLFYAYTYSGSGVWPSYIPDLRSAALGGYGADSPATSVEPGTGERLIQRHLIHLFGLQGAWQDRPGLP